MRASASWVVYSSFLLFRYFRSPAPTESTGCSVLGADLSLSTRDWDKAYGVVTGLFINMSLRGMKSLSSFVSTSSSYVKLNRSIFTVYLMNFWNLEFDCAEYSNI